MTDLNTLQTLGIEGVTGYRSGDLLIAKEGFVAPRVCIVSGRVQDVDLISTKVFLEPLHDGIKVFMIKLLLKVMAVAYFVIAFAIYGAEPVSIFSLVSLSIWISLYYFISGKITPSMMVFFDREVREARWLRSVQMTVCLAAGSYLIVSDLKEESAWWMLLGGGLIALSYVFKEKSGLVSLGIDADDYECFKGAHPDFLDKLESREK